MNNEVRILHINDRRRTSPVVRQMEEEFIERMYPLPNEYRIAQQAELEDQARFLQSDAYPFANILSDPLWLRACEAIRRYPLNYTRIVIIIAAIYALAMALVSR